MSEDEVRKSGLVYIECPICNHIVPCGEFSREYAQSDFSVHLFCKQCDKDYYGVKDSDLNISLWNEPNFALFSKPDYKTCCKKNDKEYHGE